MNKTSVILIRKSPTHAVIAHVKWVKNGVELVRLSEDTGPVPEWEPGLYLTIRHLRMAVLSWMKIKGPWTTLDRVLLSKTVVEQWEALAERLAPTLIGKDIPDEMARELPGGWLLIHVPGIPEAQMKVKPGHWAWVHRQH